MTEKEYFLGFSVFPGVGAGRFRLLLEHFQTAKNAWEAPESELKTILKEKLTADFLAFRKSFDFDLYSLTLEKVGVSVITLNDKAYPKVLRDLENQPFVIYVKGDKNLLQAEKRIGVVGTRKVTTYGNAITQSFTRELVEEGFIVVSGLALGVDAIAHQETLNTGGKTIAVLGCGVDCCYPSTNYGLYKEIIDSGGLIVSEYPLSAPPNKGSFPSRNRIIAALSQGLLVTEGAEDSGSLITAGIALDLGRAVFAIPGPVTSSLSRGPLKLIRKGAKLVTGGEEILEELGLPNKKKEFTKIVGDTKEEQLIISCLLNEELSFDEIGKKTAIPSNSLGAVLSIMEMKGFLKIDAAGNFSIIS